MKNVSKLFSVLFIASFVFDAAAATAITLDRVKQRYPWNGLVDIDYTVSGFEGAAADYTVVFTVTCGEQSLTPVNFLECSDCDLPVADGSYHVTWDTAADGVEIFSESVGVKAELKYRPVTEANADYMIVDLSGGASAASYPVKYARGTDPKTFNRDVYKTTKIVFKRVTAATFQMGDAGDNNSKPVHEVTLTKDFFLGLFELTRYQYSQVVSSYPTKTMVPLTAVFWNTLATTSTGFFALMSSKALYKGAGVSAFDFPTDAQWERACRADTTTSYFWGTATTDLGLYTWHADNGGLCAVGLKLPNPFGFYDITGNASEMCKDWMNPYTSAPAVDPVADTAASGVTKRSSRGGSWRLAIATYAKSGVRRGENPGSWESYAGDFVGVRASCPLGYAGITEPPAATTLAQTAPTSVALDTRTDAVRVITDTADLLPFVYNSSASWGSGGDVAATATITIDNYSGNPAAEPETWNATGASTVLLSATAGEGTSSWAPTQRRLYKANLTVGATVLSAWFDLTGATALTLPVDLATADIVLSQTSYVCDGDPKLPTVTVTCGGNPLAEGTDYTKTVSYNVNPGTVTITLYGIGGYGGVKTVQFTITEPVSQLVAENTLANCPAVDTRTVAIRDIAELGEILPFAYNSDIAWAAGGNGAVTADLRVYVMNATDATNVLTWAETGDYTNIVSASGESTANWVPGKQNLYKAVLTNATTVLTAYFDLLDAAGLEEVIDASTFQLAIDIDSFFADGTEHAPALTVRDADGVLLTEGVDYTYAISDMMNPGTSVITITGMGNYTGTKTITYTIAEIVPAQVAESAASAAVAVDAREGVLTLRTPKELNAVAWNNTTNAWERGGVSSETTLAKVSVAPMESVEDEPPTANYTLLHSADEEGTFSWHTRKGIWSLKLEFEFDGVVDDSFTLYRTVFIALDSGLFILIK